MIWKTIGHSVIGTSHVSNNGHCEDAIAFNTTPTDNGEVLLCCISDGAGSAMYAQEAATFVTQEIVSVLSEWITTGKSVHDTAIIMLLENVYDALLAKATEKATELNEYSCTVLCCVLFETESVFFQIGDGAIIRNDGDDNYTTIWWPQNGEYSNSTCFLIDDPNFPYLKKAVLSEQIMEIALLTDGLQMLTLNVETSSVHQPFFTDLFKWLRFADKPEEVAILSEKLKDYLGSERINSRTDDDKTLFLATRLQP